MLVQFIRGNNKKFIPINRLYRERLLFLGQQVDDEIANQLIGIMMYLNGEDESKDMYLYINSPGGAVLAGISVYDAMQFVVPDVHTICMGLAASMGSFISTGGEITKRIALPHASCQCFFPTYPVSVPKNGNNMTSKCFIYD
jgi:ATP-dependent Clp protease protease subunit